MTTDFTVQSGPLEKFGTDFRSHIATEVGAVKSYLAENATVKEGEGGIIFHPLIQNLNLVLNIANPFLDALQNAGTGLGDKVVGAAQAYKAVEAANVSATGVIKSQAAQPRQSHQKGH